MLAGKYHPHDKSDRQRNSLLLTFDPHHSKIALEAYHPGAAGVVKLDAGLPLSSYYETQLAFCMCLLLATNLSKWLCGARLGNADAGCVSLKRVLARSS